LPARTEGEASDLVPLVERVQSILASKHLTLYRVSRQSVARYGRSSAFFIPHNLYSDLRASFTPSIQQIAALSRISGYRLVDWLIVFGLNLENIIRLQVLLPSKRTILLDNSLTDLERSIPWFHSRANAIIVPPIAPLVQLLERTPPRTIASLASPGARDFLYVKVGTEDDFAFPELAPGSILRINPNIEHAAVFPEVKQGEKRMFLIEHSKGLCCSTVHSLAADVIVPVGTSLPYAQIPLRVPTEARILGVVDLEIRLLLKTEPPTVPRDLARRWKPQVLPSNTNLGQRLQRARAQMNLSLREAAGMSRRIAEMSGNPHYRISASSLYDYEQSADSPRDFYKVASLCSLYGLQAQLFLDAMGMANEEDPKQSIPAHLLPRNRSSEIWTEASNHETDSGVLQTLLRHFGELPLFLWNSLDTLSSSAKVAFDDFYWIGGENNALHPYLFKGLLAIVNRRRKTAFHFASKPLWQQPIYLVLRRDGEYLAACCGAENGTLVVHPYGPDFHPPLVFRNHLDAEIIGQIVAIARRVG
jgi:transcriptional regulator with XRE-family HTH domain